MSKWSKKYYHRDGKQPRFYKKAHIKHRAKTRMYLYFLYCKKWRILIYLTKPVLKSTSNDLLKTRRKFS